ncbi:hypothetical protein B0A55_08834 [Friedmanniomyces simplex]|uniref:Uncharacterized protein n=1 Tax=Friedmanniomyces simplex TaxID=329884 RepID=A0A4V5NFK2_9PEZI|nr:hypothetical protein B0A55_08834 [Friedmanniomyces simplex]
MPNPIRRYLEKRRAINEELRAEEQRRGDARYYARLQREGRQQGFPSGSSASARSSAPPLRAWPGSSAGSPVSRAGPSEPREIVGYTTSSAIRVLGDSSGGFSYRPAQQYYETIVVPIYAPVGRFPPASSTLSLSGTAPNSTPLDTTANGGLDAPPSLLPYLRLTVPSAVAVLLPSDGPGHHTPSPSRSGCTSATDSPSTPQTARSLFSRGGGSEGGYDTPETSPEPSPVKPRPGMWRFPQLTEVLEQLDGPASVTANKKIEQHAVDEDDLTPLVPASPAKDTRTHSSLPAQTGTGSPQRRPSALLKHCESNATPRQRRLMNTGLRSPDRFVLSRAGTPTKESLLSNKPAEKHTTTGRHTRLQNGNSDPFAPPTRRTFRMAEQFATLRAPTPLPRAVGRGGTLITSAPDIERRAVSDGAVWTVGGALVTEGVASTPNGRGGRVTSGTSAPHYAADFLRKASASEEEKAHGRRLALAMDIDQVSRMLDHSSPISSRSPSTAGSPASRSSPATRTWRDGAWDAEGPAWPTKRKPKKAKDIPIIPFRVLDAPALRDDYYCSLLAYSPTLHCLAVGLGSHVYLWSEDKAARIKHPPDSLTAPFAAHVTSISFSSAEGESAILAIGRADGRITLWSPLDRDPRFDSEQPAPVSCVCFRPNTAKRASVRESCIMVQTEELLVGDEAGNVYLYAVEWPDQEQRDLFDWHGSMTLLARISCHSQQVCGMAWSPDGEVIATGGNDNQLFVFDHKKILRSPQPPPPAASATKISTRTRGDSDTTIKVRSGSSSADAAAPQGQAPVLIITLGQHKHLFLLNAAVKALAFAPWQPSLLAAGGGSNDRCIHFFHAASGAKLATIDCFAQVTSLVWSAQRRELAATFGFAQPEHRIRVAVFGWPGCECRVKVPWVSEERALWGVAYPRGPQTGAGKCGSGIGREGQGGEMERGRRTRNEGCLVVATSDASIKFHEVWADEAVMGDWQGTLGGSQILEGVLGMERSSGIR